MDSVLPVLDSARRYRRSGATPWPLLLLLGLLAGCGGGGSGAPDGPPTPPGAVFYPEGVQIPVTGPAVPGMAPFDQGIRDFMRRWNVPGAALAIAKDGKLILARGYGYADFEAKQPVQPDSMFRIGSTSKMLTSLAILRLRDRGQLDLEQTFLSILTEFQVGPSGDARLATVTLRHLLQHSGGWDRSVAGDPLFQSMEISAALGVPRPVTTADVIRYALNRPLQFTPGTRFAYSNVGYTILGRVIEKVSGQSYESYVREQVLASLGVNAMSIGRSHQTERGPFEVRYYPSASDPLVDSEFLTEGKVPMPYQFDMSRLDAAGGWIASPIDLTRMAEAFDGASGFLTADSLAQLMAPPPYSGSGGLSFPDAAWYGLGISVGPNQAYGHGGALPGTAASLFHDSRGYTMVVLMNTQGGSQPLYFDVVTVMTQALGAGLEGSPADLYPQYPSPSLPASRP